ncbi:hypothetical protein Q604_UNBC05130G0001, partial [human gut metagenome]
VAIGSKNTALGSSALAVGNEAKAKMSETIAIGHEAKLTKLGALQSVLVQQLPMYVL